METKNSNKHYTGRCEQAEKGLLPRINKMTSSNDLETAVQKFRASLKGALETEQRLEAAIARAAVSEKRLMMTLAEHAAARYQEGK